MGFRRPRARRGERAIPKHELNILFTCVGRRVALMDAFRRAMAKLDCAGKIIATDVTSSSPAFQRADVGCIMPSVGRIEYIPSLLGIVRKHRIGLVVPLTDLDLRSLARQRDQFTGEGCTVMIGSEPVVALCRDKARINSLLTQAGLSTIRTCTLREFRTQPFYPCFVKPVRGSAGVGAGVINNEKELTAHVATYGDLLLVQDYVPGQEFTVDVYRSRDGQVRCVVPRQRLVVRSGEVEKGVTVHDPELIEATTKLASLLDDMWGVFCCQCRRPGGNGGAPRFFEINPRFGGGSVLSIAAGADLPLYLLQEVLGQPITATVGEFTDHLLMLRYDEAVFMQVDAIDKLSGFNQPMFR